MMNIPTQPTPPNLLGEITEWVNEVSGRNTCKVRGAVLNWKGAFSPASAALLKELGLTKRDLQLMSMRA